MWLNLFQQFHIAPKSLFSRCSWRCEVCCWVVHVHILLCVCVSGRPCAPLVTLRPETGGEGEENIQQSLWRHAPPPSLRHRAALSLYSSSWWPVTALHKTHSASNNNKHISTCSAVLLLLFPFPPDCRQNIVCLLFSKYLDKHAVMGEDEACEPEKNWNIRGIIFPFLTEVLIQELKVRSSWKKDILCDDRHLRIHPFFPCFFF